MTTPKLLATFLMLATPLALTASTAGAQSSSQPATTAQSAPAPAPAAAPAPPGPEPHGWGPPQQAWYMDGPQMAQRDRGGRGMDRWDRGGGLLPLGMWWKDPRIVSWLGLTAEQQKRVGDMFLQSRLQLIHLHATLQEQQLLLEPMLDATPFDETKAVAQIDKIADTRAELEKTNAKMLLDFRGVLTAEQWTRLRDRRFTMHRPGPWDDGGPAGGAAGAKADGPGM